MRNDIGKNVVRCKNREPDNFHELNFFCLLYFKPAFYFFLDDIFNSVTYYSVSSFLQTISTRSNEKCPAMHEEIVYR